MQPLADALTGDTNWATGVAFSPSGHTLYSGSEDGTIRQWDTRRARPMGAPILGPINGINGIALSPDGRLLAAAGQDGQVWLWHTGHAQEPAMPEDSIPGVYVARVAFSPNGKFLAAGSSDGTVHIWRVTPAGHLHAFGPALRGQTAWIIGLAFSPNGKIMASGSGDGTIRLWDVAQHRPLGRPLVAGAEGAGPVVFSRDGRILVSGDYINGGTIRFWDVSQHRPLGSPLQTHTDGVSSLAFSPDGTMLATAEEQQIQLWDVASRQPLGPPLSATHAGSMPSASARMARPWPRPARTGLSSCGTCAWRTGSGWPAASPTAT